MSFSLQWPVVGEFQVLIVAVGFFAPSSNLKLRKNKNRFYRIF